MAREKGENMCMPVRKREREREWERNRNASEEREKLFSLSPLFPLLPQMITHSHTQTLPPLHVITPSKDKRERETYTVLKTMFTLKKRRENVPNTLPFSFPTLLFLPLFFTFSLSFSLFKSVYLFDIWTNSLLKEIFQSLHIFPLNRRPQSITVSACISLIWGHRSHQSTGVVRMRK